MVKHDIGEEGTIRSFDSPDDICGVKPFTLPKSHPFTPVCAMHDRLFESKHEGFFKGSRKYADKMLLKGMLKVAKEKKSFGLKLQAYLYYTLVRIFGRIFW